MERKIGEIFFDNGKKLQCIKANTSTCQGCYYRNFDCGNRDIRGVCCLGDRTDHSNVIFKEIKDMENQKEIKISIPEGYEIDKEKSSFEKIVFKKKEQEVKTWEDLMDQKREIPKESVFIKLNSTMHKVGSNKFSLGDENVFVDERHAKAALAMAQISQLMPYYGGAITDKEWNDSEIPKYSLGRYNSKLVKEINYSTHYSTFSFISFHTEEQRDSFYENNKQLVEDYWMIPSQSNK